MSNKSINIGVLGCSEIAYRRFMPAVEKVKGVNVICIAEEYDKNKLKWFRKKYPLDVEDTFDALINRNDIDAIYIPQPPALHYELAKQSLLAGKHVLVEKPSTVCLQMTKELVDIAIDRKLVVYENYMFQYHKQIAVIKDIINEGEIGEVRLIRTDFTFPKREQNDFRYNKKLGGGALLDAGGYPVRLAGILLGDSVKVDASRLNYCSTEEVDIYGSATLSNESGLTCQISFGMDNLYQCNLNIVGAKGRIFTNRVFTAPADYQATIELVTDGKQKIIDIEPDSSFEKSIKIFVDLINNPIDRNTKFNELVLQAKLIEDIKNMAKRV